MKHLKHLFTALMLLCTTVATAHDFEVDGIYYNILSETDKTVEVTFKGNSYLHYFSEYTGRVVIPESVTYDGITYSVTNIGGSAFEYCSGLTSIVIGNSVTSIGEGAFHNCDGLTSIEIPNSVTSIGGSAFYNCDGLTSIEIPNSVTSIGDWVFGWCFGLTSIEIPNSVTSIGEGAFSNCSGLTSIEIPNSVTSIAEDAFRFCFGLTSISVVEGNAKYDSRENCNAIIETVSNTLIFGCKNTTIPNSVTSIGVYAFYGYTGLTSIEIPNSVTSIGDGAFCGCSGLTSIVIPNSVTSIEAYAFYYCDALTSITSRIPADKLFAIDSNVFYNVDKNACTLYVPYGAKETYAATKGWSEFKNIVELEPSEITVTINEYGSATYCSEYALDFSEVEGLKAYSAIGYKPSTQTVTLARVMTTGAGQGVFIKGEPGEYTVPVIDNFDEYTLNLFVGTLESTIVNSTDGEMSNYKFTIADGDTEPMFYPFVDGTTLSAGKAYLQIPTVWLPATAQKSLNIRFDEGETTDVDELKGENGKLKGENGEVKTIYDLSGRVVENPTSGIYIIDGKKCWLSESND